MSIAKLQAELTAARAAVNRETFGTDAWEAAMRDVRALCRQIDADSGLRAEPYCSVDSGIHPTKLSDGRVIRPGQQSPNPGRS